MLLSELATSASGMTEAAFLEAHPQPALVFHAPGASIGDSDDATLHGESLWARTSAGDGLPAMGPAAIVTLEIPAAQPLDRTPLVAFLKKSKRNPFAGLVVLGRQPRADVVVASSTISKVHLIFAEEAGGRAWTVLDQQSTNGTMLNGVALTKGQATKVRDGDTLVFGGAIHATFCEPRTVFCMVDTWRRGEPLGAHGWVRVATPSEGLKLPPRALS